MEEKVDDFINNINSNDGEIMENSRSYAREKRKIKDRCNICGKITDLTWDHVPPKFCFNSQRAQYNSLLEVNEGKHYTHISQNGIRYRSICSECNNNLLGSNYDKEYKKLVDLLYEIYITPGEIGQYIEIQGIEVNKVARAIVGHFLAARNEYIDSKVESELREYFLNPNLRPPNRFKLLYYVYIYNTIMIIRDVAPKKFGKLEYSIPEGLISCINTFPLSFILAHDCENNVELDDLFEVCTENINEKRNMRVNLLSYKYPNKKELRHPYWPCNVSDDDTGTSMMLVSDNANSSVFSQIRDLRMKK